MLAAQINSWDLTGAGSLTQPPSYTERARPIQASLPQLQREGQTPVPRAAAETASVPYDKVEMALELAVASIAADHAPGVDPMAVGSRRAGDCEVCFGGPSR